MKKLFLFILLSALLLTGCVKAENNSEAEPVYENDTTVSKEDNSVSISLSFNTNASGIVYAAWVEDPDGNLIKTLYACNSLMKTRGGEFNGRGYLTGDPLPYFKTKNGWTPADSGWRYSEDKYSIDGITGASPAANAAVLVTGKLDFDAVAGYRVCLDIDNSVNTNAYFQDRPAFTYKTELINSPASAEYTLSLDGWMGNATTGDPWGQDPRRTIQDYELFKYMQGETYLPYIIDNDGDYDNLVSSVTVKVN